MEQGGQVLAAPRGGWRPNRWMHLLSASRSNRRVIVRLQLFVGPGYQPPMFVVAIGTHDNRIIRPREAMGHAFIFFHPEPNEGDLHGQVEELIAVDPNGLIQRAPRP